MVKKSKILAKEIFYVFKEVENIIPELSNYHLSADKQTWLPLQKGSNVSMRDYILLKYAEIQQQKKFALDKDLLLICALSFDIVSSAKHFDVDHFFPQSEIMNKLDNLGKDQNLLFAIKKILKTLLKETQKPDHAANYAEQIVNLLIPYCVTEQKLKVSGLKRLYYNYPANLWPISAPVNRSKGKKESIGAATSFVLQRVGDLLGKNHARMLAKKTARDLGISDEKFIKDHIKLNNIEKTRSTVDFLSENILRKFEEKCGVNKDNCILPHIKQEDQLISMLSFFQTTTIGKTSAKFSQETASNAKEALLITRIITQHAMARQLTQDPKVISNLQSINKGAKIFLKAVCKSLKQALDDNLGEHSLDSIHIESSLSSSSEGSLDSTANEFISKLDDRVENNVDEVIARKRARSQDKKNEQKVKKHKHTFSKI